MMSFASNLSCAKGVWDYFIPGGFDTWMNVKIHRSDKSGVF